MNTKSRLGAAAVALIVTIAGCSSGGGGGDGDETKKELSLYNDKGAWTPFFEEIGKKSKEETGLSLKPVGYTDEPQYEAAIKAAFRTKNKPDLFTWTTGGRLEEIVEKNLIADTSDIWAEGLKNGDLTEDLKPYYTYNGKQYCVPLNVAYWGMFYNKKVFDKHGLKPPETWDDLIGIAETLKKNGVKAFYHTSILFSFVWFEQILAGTDPDLYDRLSQGKAKYTDPGVVEVMKKWKSLIDAGYFTNPGNKTDPADLLKDGKAAMASFGTFFNTSMTQRNLKPGEDYDFFVIPNVESSLDKTSVVFESGPLCSMAEAPAPEASKKAMKWWITESAQSKWSNDRGDASANPKVKSADNPALGKVSKEAGEGQYRLVNRYFEATPPPVLTAALDEFGKFVGKPGTYMEVLENIQKEADKYWAKQ